MEREREDRWKWGFMLVIFRRISSLMSQASFVLSFSEGIPWVKKRMKSVSACMPWTIPPILLVLWSVVWMHYSPFTGYPSLLDGDTYLFQLGQHITSPPPLDDPSSDSSIHLDENGGNLSHGPGEQRDDFASWLPTDNGWSPRLILGLDNDLSRLADQNRQPPLNDISGFGSYSLWAETQPTTLQGQTTVPIEADGMAAVAPPDFDFTTKPLVHSSPEHIFAPASRGSTNASGDQGSGNIRQTHENNEQNKKPTGHKGKFMCRKCDRSWQSPKDLNRHVRSIHEKSTPYYCDVNGCPRQRRGFPRKDNRDRHVLKHKRKDATAHMNSDNTLIDHSTGTLRAAAEMETATSVCNALNEPRGGEMNLAEYEMTREELLERLREELEKQAREKKELEKREEEKTELEEKLKVIKDQINASEERVNQLIEELAKNRGQ
ncbi:hypothetical protein HD806DRAFT_508120 [Xylariaceae sp. AK1471]|nr:hypothetical protein HD806DRAFT_508120 [Xylariaceae sp. AK1471]